MTSTVMEGTALNHRIGLAEGFAAEIKRRADSGGQAERSGMDISRLDDYRYIIRGVGMMLSGLPAVVMTGKWTRGHN
jgi:hypothetical protein